MSFYQNRKSFLIYDFLLGQYIQGRPLKEGLLQPLLDGELILAEITVTRGRSFPGGTWWWINLFLTEDGWDPLPFQSDLDKLQSATRQLRTDLLEARASDFDLVALLRHHWKGEIKAPFARASGADGPK